MRLGSGVAGAELKITLGSDGGTLQVSVVDSNGKAVTDTGIWVAPADLASERVLADSVVEGRTDASGSYTTPPLSPGRYRALATASAIDKSPEGVVRLWRALSAASTVEVRTGRQASLRVERKSVE